MRRYKLLICSLFVLWLPAGAIQAGLAERKDAREFIQEMASKHGFEQKSLEKLFNRVELKESIIKAISRPAESKPWYQYREIFLTKKRIDGGVTFWAKNADALRRAEQEYGVPPQMIVAILGVETRYGEVKGRFRIIDALSTLAFDYPRRGEFFRKELEEFLLLCKEEGIDPLKLTGSYAGAMGKPQFMPSSFRAYAVDFDGDGKKDLWNNTTDAIGSVANYFKRHHWQPGDPVVSRVNLNDQAKGVVSDDLRPSTSVQELVKQGVAPEQELPSDSLATVFALELKNGSEYWLGLQNFYVITRYNRSALYAMAAYLLGEAIREQHLATLDKKASLSVNDI